MKLSHRVEQIEASKTARFTPLLQELKKAGRHVVNFAVGEPAFEPDAAVIAATRRALADGNTGYGPVPGLPELQDALSKTFAGVGADNILVANGSKQVLYALFQVLCDPGDEVIIPSPYWVSFAEQVKLAGAVPVLVGTRGHQLDPAAVEDAITRKTKAILVNSPNNPTGAVYAASALEAVADLAVVHDLMIVSDEAYRFFVYDDAVHHSLHALEAVRDRCIVVGSFSKTYSMTGFRVGFAAAPRPVIEALSRLQSHMTGNVCTFAQYGALKALALNADIIEKNRLALQRKRDLAYAYASEMFPCIRPQGAFYLFPDVSGHLKNGATAENFAARLLEKAGVAVIPGEAFGVAGHIRISFARPENELIQGFERIKNIL